MKNVAFCMLLAACAVGCEAKVETTREPAHPHEAAAAGWERLGVREVDGKADHDVIDVGAREGRFSAIDVRVDGAPIEMFEIVVHFGDGETFRPETRLVFDANTRTRVIELPGNRRVITKVEFRYGNLQAGRRAHVELFGKTA